MIGFGTYRLKGKVCTEAMETALSCGYRIFDTATFYQNFDGIAEVLKNHDRHELYIISKVWHDMQSPTNLKKDLSHTLKELQTDYLDAYLIHWPNSKISIEKTLGAMEEFRKEKKIRAIGLCNVTVNHMRRVLEVGVPITWVQVEMHPFFCDFALLEFCKKHGIGIQAWRPLDLGRIAEDALLQEIAKKHKKTACQIALRWIVQHDCMPLPSSKSEEHMRENIAIIDFALSAEEMHKIDKRAAGGKRYRIGPDHGLGFTDEFDFTYEQCWPKR